MLSHVMSPLVLTAWSQSIMSPPRLSRVLSLNLDCQESEQSSERRIQEQFGTQSVMDALTASGFSIIELKSICKHDVMNLNPESEAYLDVTGINQNNEMRLFSVNKLIELKDL